MLSYQHSYHAGNFADVHKHIALVMLLRSLQQKPAPLCFVDCHAGRGLYDLEGEAARRTREAESGIVRLRSAAREPVEIRDYLDLVASFNPGGSLRCYPGSAALAQSLLRADDRAILMELHPQEHVALRRFIGRDPRIGVHRRDCYEGLPALLPPAVRRGLVLIDPSYEVKSEYVDVVGLLSRALQRWTNAVYVLWYPILATGRHEVMLDRLVGLAPPRTLNSEIRIEADADSLQGSGLVVVNTPWQFEARLRDAMESVAAMLLAADAGAHRLRWLQPD